MSRRLTLPLIALVSAVALVAGGCSGGSEPSDRAVEKAIEDAASEQGQDVDVDVDDDKITVDTSEGTVSVNSGELPDGYPAAEVPVVDGEIISALAVPGSGFAVTVIYDGDADAALADAVGLLTGAGMAPEGGDNPIGSVMTGNGYRAVVTTSSAGDGGTTVSYAVTPL